MFQWSKAFVARSWGGVVGIVGLLALWEILAVTWLTRIHLAPTVSSVVATLFHHPNLELWSNMVVTMKEAGLGWLIGNGIAIVAAVLFVQIPVLEAALLRIALASYCMPVIAIGPILDIVFSGIAPRATLAALAVVFTTLIGTLVGLRSADPIALDVVRAYGGGSWAQLRRVRLRAALPATFASLAIAGPAAVLGAIIGEYLGGDSGLGVAMVNSEQGLEVSLTWALAIVIAAIAGASYLVVALVGRQLTPWADQGSDNARPSVAMIGSGQTSRVRAVSRVLRSLGFMVLSAGIAVGIWQGFIDLFHLNPFFAKGPVDVFDYLFTSTQASANRDQLWASLLTTLRDTGLGYVAGTIVAFLIAPLVVLSRGFEQTFMPVAIVLRSVPLIAMAPLLILFFGHGLVGVTVIAGIVTFFPTLVNVVFGLRSPPQISLDLLLAYGGGQPSLLRKVRLPYALPALFASARIAAPGALLGAVVAEWLATGQGLGYQMLESAETSQFDFLWAGVVLVTLVAVVMYNVIATCERLVLAHYAMGSA